MCEYGCVRICVCCEHMSVCVHTVEVYLNGGRGTGGYNHDFLGGFGHM